MRPLIPRVRPGDILKGTRNLRNWLQTASILNYLSQVRHDYVGAEKAKGQLYTPSKDDEFLVTVNAWNMFGVYGPNKDVVLLFHNSVEPVSLPPRLRRALRKTRKGRKGPPAWPNPHAPRMNPTIFSQWFIRTNKKDIEVGQWPRCAAYMWVSLHLNLCAVPSNQKGAPYHPHRGANAANVPFLLHDNGQNWDDSVLKQVLQAWYPRGITRVRSENFLERDPYGMGPLGPHLGEIPQMKKEIRQYCENPRIRAKIKKDKGDDWVAFSQNYLSSVNDS